MSYEVPASKRSIKQDVFEYAIGGKTYKVVTAKYLNGHQMEAVTSGDLTGIFNIFGTPGSPEGEAIRTLDQEQLEALIEAWTSDSDLTLGESPAS